jgi:hypothetical protein
MRIMKFRGERRGPGAGVIGIGGIGAPPDIGGGDCGTEGKPPIELGAPMSIGGGGIGPDGIGEAFGFDGS